MTQPLVPLARDVDEASIAELVAEGRSLHTRSQTITVFDLPRPRTVRPVAPVSIFIPDTATMLVEGMSSYGD